MIDKTFLGTVIAAFFLAILAASPVVRATGNGGLYSSMPRERVM